MCSSLIEWLATETFVTELTQLLRTNLNSNQNLWLFVYLASSALEPCLSLAVAEDSGRSTPEFVVLTTLWSLSILWPFLGSSLAGAASLSGDLFSTRRPGTSAFLGSIPFPVSSLCFFRFLSLLDKHNKCNLNNEMKENGNIHASRVAAISVIHEFCHFRCVTLLCVCIIAQYFSHPSIGVYDVHVLAATRYLRNHTGTMALLHFVQKNDPGVGISWIWQTTAW